MSVKKLAVVKMNKKYYYINSDGNLALPSHPKQQISFNQNFEGENNKIIENLFMDILEINDIIDADEVYDFPEENPEIIYDIYDDVLADDLIYNEFQSNTKPEPSLASGDSLSFLDQFNDESYFAQFDSFLTKEDITNLLTKDLSNSHYQVERGKYGDIYYYLTLLPTKKYLIEYREIDLIENTDNQDFSPYLFDD